MDRLELIEQLIKGNYENIIAADASMKPLSGKNLFDKSPIIDYLKTHPDLFLGFHIVDGMNTISLIGETSEGLIIKVSFKNNLIQKIVVKRPEVGISRIKMIVEYDGTEYCGFQRQSNLKTIQSILEEALFTITGTPTIINGASRTDTGVHALGQVIHFDTLLKIDIEKWPIIMNNILPKAIRIKSAMQVSQLFHSRFDVAYKEYCYILNLGEYSPFSRLYEWTISYSIDLERFEKELKKLEGTHDFTSFCKGEKTSKIRTIYETRLKKDGNKIFVSFIGDGFLHNMIRIIMAVLVNLSSGQLEGDVDTILTSKSRKITNRLAPSSGLYLVKVQY
jgi:tRNA pseudouridine38-40 synthase